MDETEYNAPLLSNIYKEYMWYPFTSKKSIDQLECFEVRSDDVLVITYPKCGTHWMNEITRLILADGHADQIDKSEHGPLETLRVGINTGNLESQDAVITNCDAVKENPSPRVLLSHMPLKFVPPQVWKKKIPIIYVARGFKDAVTSLYNFQKNGKLGEKPLIESFEVLLKNCLDGSVPYNGWFEHVKEYWNVKERENVMFVTYEELQKDIATVTSEIAKFLGHSLTPAALDRVVLNSAIKKMRQNHDETGLNAARSFLKENGWGDFMDAGLSGRWKQCFTVEQSERVDDIYKEKMSGYEELQQRICVQA